MICPYSFYTKQSQVLTIQSRILLKTLWEKEKMRATCLKPTFSPLPTMSFTLFKDKPKELSNIYFEVCKCFQFRQGYIFVIW